MSFASLSQRFNRLTRLRSSDRAARRWPRGYRPLIEALEDRCVPATYTVTNTLDAGLGSLRQAILDVNSDSTPDLIDFNIPGSGVQTIAVGNPTGLPLPAFTNSVAIDGYSQPGSSVNTLSVGDNAVLQIEIDGTALGPGFNGLHITAGNCTVRGLMIDNFARTAGPAFAGGNAILVDTNGGNVIEGNILGTNGSGNKSTFASSNGNTDLTVDAGSGNNVIGGTTPDTRNIFSGAGEGAVITLTAGSGNLFEGNYVGTDPTGTSAVPNFDGLDESGTGDTIGGTVSGARNVFSGNTRSGVGLGFAVNDVVEGNFIGINAQGTAPLPDDFGVLGAAGSGNTIGGTTPGAGNVIGGLYGAGFGIDDSGAPAGTNNFVIEGNFIGTDPTHTLNFGNEVGVFLAGVRLSQGVANTTVSGNVIDNGFEAGVFIYGPGARNNVVQGNLISRNPASAQSQGNGIGVEVGGGAFDNTVGGTLAAAVNVISGNVNEGVLVTDSGTTGNLVEGNYVGTDASGSVAVANGTGVQIASGASSNTVGGTTAAARNVISGNSGEGLVIADSATTGNLVEGNYVGTDASGSVPLANFDGIALSGTGNTIGGTMAGAGNVFSGNVRCGVAMGFAFNDVLEGNLIGVNAQGTARLTNGSFGVLAEAGSGDTIGGTALGAGNVIGGLSGDGVEIDDSAAPAGTNNFAVEGNFLGTDPKGMYTFGNAIGILIEGNAVTQGVANSTVAGNVIDNQFLVGLEIFGIAVQKTLVEGNLIGTDPTGTLAHGNGVGVEVAGGAHNNSIGGTAAGASNVIAYNTGTGVVIGSSITDDGTVGNSVRGNSIHDNGGLGIDIGNDGVTANHAVNPSPGPNNLQDFPVLLGAVSVPTGTLLVGQFHSTPNTTFWLDFYASPTADPSHHGEGQRYLGSVQVTTNAAGNVVMAGIPVFLVELSAATTPGQVISATATDPGGDTSEFSADITVLGLRRAGAAAAQPAIASPIATLGGGFGYSQNSVPQPGAPLDRLAADAIFSQAQDPLMPAQRVMGPDYLLLAAKQRRTLAGQLDANLAVCD
jgi:titin